MCFQTRSLKETKAILLSFSFLSFFAPDTTTHTHSYVCTENVGWIILLPSFFLCFALEVVGVIYAHKSVPNNCTTLYYRKRRRKVQVQFRMKAIDFPLLPHFLSNNRTNTLVFFLCCRSLGENSPLLFPAPCSLLFIVLYECLSVDEEHDNDLFLRLVSVMTSAISFIITKRKIHGCILDKLTSNFHFATWSIP